VTDPRQPTGPIVLTGATGFLGRAVVRELLGRGLEVIALVRPESVVAGLPDAVTRVPYTALDDSQTSGALARLEPKAFVHLGWAGVGGATRASFDHAGTNVPAAIASVELATAAGCDYWLGIGSQAEYGPSVVPLTEDAPLAPVSAYGNAKVAAWSAASSTAETNDLDAGWARVFSIYGPGDHDTAVLPFAIRSMLAGRSPALGMCTHDWDLLYVEDAARALADLVQVRAIGPVNVASGERRPLRDAIDIAAAAIGGPPPGYGERSDAGVTPLRAVVDRLQSLTGWEPRVPLERGVPALVADLRESGYDALIGATPT
jgi:nucleoside-diphosphate-sugar epimerase